MTSDFDKQPEKAAADLVFKFIAEGVIAADAVFMFDPAELEPEIGKRDLGVYTDTEGNITSVAVSPNVLEKMREAGYDI